MQQALFSPWVRYRSSRPGDRVRILTRSPVGHYRVPLYLRGKAGTVEAVIEPPGIDNEEEAYGRNAGIEAPLLPRRHSDDRDLGGLRRLAAGRPAHRGVRDLAGEDLSHEPHETTTTTTIIRMTRSASRSAPGYYEIMETAVRELLIEKRLIGPDEIRRQIEVLDLRTPALGARSWRAPGSIRRSRPACSPTAGPPARSSASVSTTTPA